MNQSDAGPTGEVLEQAARSLAAEILAPRASEVDQTGVIPNTHFDALANTGLFGAALDAGAHFNTIIEVLSEGCLATTFVWMQHHGLTARLAQPGLAPPLATVATRLRHGQTRAGIVQAGLLPGEPLLTARRHADGWLLDGFSPWCTGWGMIDEMLVAARLAGEAETVVWFMIEAKERQGLVARRLDLQAVDATVTVSLHFDEFAVTQGRCLGTAAFAEVGHSAGRGLRPNASLALGLSRRCAARVAAESSDLCAARATTLYAQIDAMREQLDSASGAELPQLRADAALLAVECATALVVASGARAAVKGSEAERAMREATFLLVFGSRPSIKQALLDRP